LCTLTRVAGIVQSAVEPVMLGATAVGQARGAARTLGVNASALSRLVILTRVNRGQLSKVRFRFEAGTLVNLQSPGPDPMVVETSHYTH